MEQTWAAGVENLPKADGAFVRVDQHAARLRAGHRRDRHRAPAQFDADLTQDSIPAFKDHKWKALPFRWTTLRKTIGIVGMGGIGSETARRLHYGFEMRVLATDAKPIPKPALCSGTARTWLVDGDGPAGGRSDERRPVTKETRQMFNESVFRKMKPTSYFINVSRGGLVDQEALVRALKEKWIRGGS